MRMVGEKFYTYVQFDWLEEKLFYTYVQSDWLKDKNAVLAFSIGSRENILACIWLAMWKRFSLTCYLIGMRKKHYFDKQESLDYFFL